MDQAEPVQTVSPWAYIPPNLQMWQFWLLFAICFSVRTACAPIPENKWRLFFLEIIPMFFGMVFAAGIFGAPYFFWCGIGLVAGCCSTSFYAPVSGWLDEKVKAWLSSKTSSLSEPVEPDPLNRKPKSGQTLAEFTIFITLCMLIFFVVAHYFLTYHPNP